MLFSAVLSPLLAQVYEMVSVDQLSQESLSTKAAEALSEQILSGQLQPGQRVDLNQFAAKWNVSITPLRDAARQLEALGLINVMPRRGVFVAQLSAKELKNIFDVRIALETVAIRLATPRIPRQQAERALRLYKAARDSTSDAERNRVLPKIDMLIHNLGYDHCDNPRLQKLIEGMRDLVKWSQRTIIVNLNEPFMTTVPEHIAICEAVCDRDADRAAAAMQDHLSCTLKRIQSFLEPHAAPDQKATQQLGA
jgi:DNA-binding GntR family transcriptional regulator